MNLRLLSEDSGRVVDNRSGFLTKPRDDMPFTGDVF